MGNEKMSGKPASEVFGNPDSDLYDGPGAGSGNAGLAETRKLEQEAQRQDVLAGLLNEAEGVLVSLRSDGKVSGEDLTRCERALDLATSGDYGAALDEVPVNDDIPLTNILHAKISNIAAADQ